MSTDTKLIKGNELAVAWRRLAPAKSVASLAVAFWGNGAAELLGLTRLASVRIICNLQSGACNRAVVEQLVYNPKVELRTINNLHAKVYIAQTGAIVGSSNCSHNGMPALTGDNSITDIDGSLEANVLLRSVQLRNELQDWFDKIWSESIEVNCGNLNTFQFIENDNFVTQYVSHSEQEDVPAGCQVMSFVDRITNQRVTAYGASLEDGRFKVYAKSQARGSTLEAWKNDKAVAPRNREKRDDLIRDNILVKKGVHFEFVQDFVFDSGHQASVVIRASAVNKNAVWKNTDT